MKHRYAAIALVCASVAFAADGFAQSQPTTTTSPPASAPPTTASPKPATPATTAVQPLTAVGTPSTGTATAPAVREPRPFTNDWKSTPKAAVVGAVKMPGRYEMKSPMTVLEAIALAQGLSDFASRDRIVVLREVNGKTTEIPFNYRKIGDNGSQQNFFLRPGDIVVVP